MNKIGKSIFNRYTGIDYSGAETPSSSLKGLRVNLANNHTPPKEVQPALSPRKYWTRRGIAEGSKAPDPIGSFFSYFYLLPWQTIL